MATSYRQNPNCHGGAVAIYANKKLKSHTLFEDRCVQSGLEVVTVKVFHRQPLSSIITFHSPDRRGLINSTISLWNY